MIINQIVKGSGGGGGVNLEDFFVYKIDPSSITNITPPEGVVSNVTSANVYFCIGQMEDGSSNFTFVGPVELLDSNGDVVEALPVQGTQANNPDQGYIEITLVGGWVLNVAGCDTLMADEFWGDWSNVMTGRTLPKQS